MRKRDIFLKILLYALYLLLFYLLQTAVFPRLSIAGIRPLILPVAAAGAALYQGSVFGALFGLAAGLLCDVAMADSTAIFTAALAVLGAAIGTLSEHFLTRSLPSLALCALGSLILCTFFQVFGFVVYQGVAPRAILLTALGQVAYSLVFVLPVWALHHGLGRRFRKAKL